MFCCSRDEEIKTSFSEFQNESFYSNCDDLIYYYLHKVDSASLINEIIFQSSNGRISILKLSMIMQTYSSEHHSKLIKFITSAFYVIPQYDHRHRTISQDSYSNYFKHSLKVNILCHFIEQVDFVEKIPKIDESQDYNQKQTRIQEIEVIYLIFYLLVYSSLSNKEKSVILFSLINTNSKYIEYEDDFTSTFSKYIENMLFLPDFVGNFYLKEEINKSAKFLEEIVQFKTALIYIKNFKGVYEDFVSYLTWNLVFFSPVTNQKIYLESIPFHKKSKERENIFYNVLEKKGFSMLKPKEIRKALHEFLEKKNEGYKSFNKLLSIFINKHNTIGIASDYTEESYKYYLKKLQNLGFLAELKTFEENFKDEDIYKIVLNKKSQGSSTIEKKVDKRKILINAHMKKKSAFQNRAANLKLQTEEDSNNEIIRPSLTATNIVAQNYSKKSKTKFYSLEDTDNENDFGSDNHFHSGNIDDCQDLVARNRSESFFKQAKSKAGKIPNTTPLTNESTKDHDGGETSYLKRLNETRQATSILHIINKQAPGGISFKMRSGSNHSKGSLSNQFNNKISKSNFSNNVCEKKQDLSNSIEKLSLLKECSTEKKQPFTSILSTQNHSLKQSPNAAANKKSLFSEEIKY